MKNPSWRTTALGIITIITAITGVVQALIDNDPATNPDLTVAIAAVISGIGLIAAKDAKVTGLPDTSEGDK
jgi:hypothetical protein